MTTVELEKQQTLQTLYLETIICECKSRLKEGDKTLCHQAR